MPYSAVILGPKSKEQEPHSPQETSLHQLTLGKAYKTKPTRPTRVCKVGQNLNASHRMRVRRFTKNLNDMCELREEVFGQRNVSMGMKIIYFPTPGRLEVRTSAAEPQIAQWTMHRLCGRKLRMVKLRQHAPTSEHPLSTSGKKDMFPFLLFFRALFVGPKKENCTCRNLSHV